MLEYAFFFLALKGIMLIELHHKALTLFVDVHWTFLTASADIYTETCLLFVLVA
jgi:hypothetical protein